MKDRKTGTWWPMFHWTDQMIRVHGLYCSLSLLIRSLILKKVREVDMPMSVNKLHEKLSGIREVLNVFSKKNKARQRNRLFPRWTKCRNNFLACLTWKTICRVRGYILLLIIAININGYRNNF